MQLLFIGDFLSEVFLGIIMVLDTLIYSLISSAYKIFMAIASARLLSSDVYYDIASRIYIIIGVLMLFVLSYAILKAIVDPDQATKGDLGPGMVKRVIIAVVGLAITPVLFNVLYQAQGLFLENDVLGKVFFRIENTESIEVNGTSGNPDEQIKNIGGAVAATSIWQAFFHPAEGINAADIKSDSSEYVGKAIGTAIACGLGIAAGVIGVATGIFTFGLSTVLLGGAAVALCASSIAGDVEQANEIAAQGGDVTLEHAYAVAAGGGGFDIFLIFIDNYIEDDEIEYFWGVSTLCGAFALYAFASFSIDMGVRAAKLAYYQIIAPIPLIMQVLPKYKDTFSKYIKNVVSTFLEVFIRISVVYIVVYVVCHLQDLFSSFGSLWGNESLNLAEKSLALAFLILGLVIFAKSAPDIICQSLNIEKGSMKLGIGKKLADGGAFAAGGVGYGAVTSAVRNWRDDKNKGFWNKARSAAAGFGSGAARAAFNQFGPGPGRKPAMNLHDLKNVGEKAAQGATDKRDRRDERQADFRAANEALTAARAEYDKVLNDSSSTMDQINAAKANIKAALQRRNEATAVGGFIDTQEKKLDAWSVGTVSTAKEEAAMKFGSDLDSLKGKLREEAYKKDGAARRLYTAYSNKKSEPINEYAEGWDEQSTNAEYRRRRAQVDELSSVHEKLQAARARGDVGESARLATQFNDLKSSVERWGVTVNADGTMTGTDYSSLVSDLKIDVNQARIERDRELEGLRMAMEAAADEFVRQKATDASSNTYRDISTFLSEHATYMSQNQNMDIVVDLDTGKKERLGDVITRTFGTGALDGKFTVTGDFKTSFEGQNSVKLDLPTSEHITVGDTTYSSVTYKLEKVTGADGKTTEMYVPYGVDKDGKESAITTSEKFKPVKTDSFFDVVAEKISSGVVKKASSETAISKASDIGKTAATHIRNNDYAEKVRRKRQAEEGKK